ncbi:hypothetical protein [Sulfitobacter sp.]|jgi:hypothetical protein|uniref:hypothetical protein n=1 Tax=Sulfitobacter sp. TaxID=1903071 RepID=UPI0030019D2B
MFVFRKNLKRAIDSSPYSKSVSKLSMDAALGEKTLGNMLNNASVDTAKAGPGLFGMKRVADLLGIPLDYLVGQNFDDRPTPNMVIERFRSTGGRIEGFSDLLPMADLYHPASEADTTLTLISQGKNSLSAQMMPSPSTANLQKVLDELVGSDLLRNTIRDHSINNTKHCFATPEEINSPMPSEPHRIKVDYIRVLARLTDSAGAAFTFNYCFRT